MGKSKKEAAPTDSGCDPAVIYNNFLKASKHIGIEPSKSLLKALADETDSTRGEFLVDFHFHKYVAR